MLICSPVDNDDAIYVFIADDNIPFIFDYVESFPFSKNTIWVEVEDEEPDDDGDIHSEEVEVRVIPTNAHSLIKFRRPYEQSRFKEVIEKYYGKEKL